jgi:alkanesulfonate monooxygenase SsuD/methylene tetrahydromethanopterin reductase-like flavin-dependent oxidoreductase (luciferase family)
MLDEGIEIITRVWRGEPFSSDGEFYKIQDVQILPQPVQKPRIPIWVGGGYPNRGPVARALRWDGSCLYKQEGHWMQPEDVRDLRERVIAERGTADGYDITIGGTPRWEDENKQRAYLESILAEGVTWWHEYIPPDVGDFDVQRKMIERGPLRID